jgi:hypothetical protein
LTKEDKQKQNLAWIAFLVGEINANVCILKTLLKEED